MQPVTWADGRGAWHVRVSRNAVAPLIAARKALCNEILPREADPAGIDRNVWMRPVRVPDMDTDDTMVYREGHVSADERCPCGASHTRAEHGYDPDN